MSYAVVMGFRTGVGKSTAAKMLSETFEELGLTVTTVSLSDPLYKAATALTGTIFHEDNKDTPLFNPFDDKSKTKRWFLKKLSKLVRKTFGETALLQGAILNSSTVGYSDVVIIPNIRSKYEYHYFMKNDQVSFVLVDGPYDEDPFDDEDLDHYDWDFTIENKGTLEDLRREVDKVAYEIRKRIPND